MRDAAKSAEWYEANRSRLLPLRRANNRKQLLIKYGISPEEYDGMHAAQAGLCAICGRPETRTGRSDYPCQLCVDHSHETGRVRGLLCHKCNTAVGLLDDDPERMNKAAEYLMRNH